jgi:predicted phosphodiesterase
MSSRVLKPLDMENIKHVFFGHTHIKFDHHEVDGVNVHNTGAFTAANVKKDDDLGILEATLNADGTITNVQPVRLEKDPVQVAIGR